jgi:hypothetical protein
VIYSLDHVFLCLLKLMYFQIYNGLDINVAGSEIRNKVQFAWSNKQKKDVFEMRNCE